MKRSPFLFLSMLVFGLTAAPASACEFVAAGVDGPEKAATFDTVADGIVSGEFRCGGDIWPAYVWTLPVDGKQKSLGIRDDALVDTTMTGPLGLLLTAGVEDHVRLTVLERTETIPMPRSPVPSGWFMFRRYFTFCETSGGGNPLDCSVGAARVKGWRTDEDTDRDGYLDVSAHEISFYNGSDKLHFMRFVTPWSDSVTSDAFLWIEALNAMSDVLQPTKLASAAP